MNLITQLRNGPSYVLNSDERQLRHKAADEIERLINENNELRAQVNNMNAEMLRQRNK